MFMGPLEVAKPWSTKGIVGVRRFLERMHKLSEKPLTNDPPPPELERLLHKTLKKVSHDTERIFFNTAISQMMVYSSELAALEQLPRSLYEPLLLILSPYAPHLAEELWEKCGHAPSISAQPWPVWDEKLTIDDTVTIVCQINGKLRSRLELPRDLKSADLEKAALADPRIVELLAGKKPAKVITVPNKLVNIVIEVVQ